MPAADQIRAAAEAVVNIAPKVDDCFFEQEETDEAIAAVMAVLRAHLAPLLAAAETVAGIERLARRETLLVIGAPGPCTDEQAWVLGDFNQEAIFGEGATFAAAVAAAVAREGEGK